MRRAGVDLVSPLIPLLQSPSCEMEKYTPAPRRAARD